jgi:hypothetical protein
MRFNTFNEVAKWYEQTKPVVSKHHKAEDNIRPIGQRKRKWERIRKVDAETYVLLDGFYGLTMYTNGHGDAQYEQDMAPVMWKREADGDYIYIRNGTKNSVPFSRFQFLRWYLPTSISFRYNQQGKHWIRAKTPTGYEDFPLPKTAYVWNYTLKQPAVADDGKRLKFRVNEDGTFTRAGNTFKTNESTIDRELKKQWKPKIEAFYTQAAVLAPMLDTTWNGRDQYRQAIYDWCKDHKIDYPEYGSLTQISNMLAQRIVEQEDHALRIPLMALVIAEIDGKREIESQADLSSIKSAYNRLMNKLLGMYETKEV